MICVQGTLFLDVVFVTWDFFYNHNQKISKLNLYKFYLSEILY